MLYSNRQKLADFISKYLIFQVNVKSTNSNTYKSYATDLKQFLNSIEAFSKNYSQNGDYSNKDLAALHYALSNWSGLKLSTRNRKHACVKGFLKWLYENDYIKEPLDHQVICPKVPQKTPHFLSFDEVMSLFKTMENDFKTESDPKKKRIYHRNYCLTLTIYAGALRVSEACQLKTLNFKPQQNIIKVLGKGNKERIVVLPNKVIDQLNNFNPLEEYFFSLNSKALNPRTAYEIIRQAGAKTGLIKPLNPHALRHSLATHLLTDGMNLRTLQDFLGHKSLVATQKYTHLGIDKLAETLSKSHPLSNKEIK